MEVYNFFTSLAFPGLQEDYAGHNGQYFVGQQKRALFD